MGGERECIHSWDRNPWGPPGNRLATPSLILPILKLPWKLTANFSLEKKQVAVAAGRHFPEPEGKHHWPAEGVLCGHLRLAQAAWSAETTIKPAAVQARLTQSHPLSRLTQAPGMQTKLGGGPF